MSSDRQLKKWLLSCNKKLKAVRPLFKRGQRKSVQLNCIRETPTEIDQ